MTDEEVYEKYKHLDTFLGHIHLGMGNSPATIQDQILYDCWQAIKAVATADPQCESQDVEISHDGEGPWNMTDQEHIADLEDRVIKQEDVLGRVLFYLRVANKHASYYVAHNLIGEKDPMLAGMKHALEIIERWNATEPGTDPLCESQDVDLDHHEADSPPWTRIDPDSLTTLMAKLDETEQERDALQIVVRELNIQVETLRRDRNGWGDTAQECEERLRKSEQQLTEARALLLEAQYLVEEAIDYAPPSVGLSTLQRFAVIWDTNTKAFLTHPTPKQLDKEKETQ